MALILDTNALSAAAESEPVALKVVAQAERLFLPVIVLSESGLELRNPNTMRPTKSGSRSGAHQSTFWTLMRATICLELNKKGKPIPMNDLWIAVLCRQHNLPLLSHEQHFDNVAGLRRIDW